MVWLIIVALVGALFGIGQVASRLALRPLDRRPPPFRLQALGFLAVFWAVVTVMTFVPAGLLLGFMAVPNAPLFGIGLVAICFNGLVFVGRAWTVPRLLFNEDIDELRKVGRHAMVHHALVAGWFGATYAVLNSDLIPAVLVPCAIGGLLGAAIYKAPAERMVIPEARVAALGVKKL